jgi:penicillin-binding protein 2
MTAFHLESRRRRAQLALGLVGVAFAALGLGFFRAQIVHGPFPGLSAPGMPVRALPEPAPRGVILDRHGAVLADNVPGYAISLLPAPPDSLRRALRALAPYLALSDDDIGGLVARHDEGRRAPLLIARDVPEHMVYRLEERRPWLPPFLVDVWPERRYPAGAAAAHLVGMVGAADDHDAGATSRRHAAVAGQVGTSGVERQYQARLAGADGIRYVRVTPSGRVIGSAAGRGTVSPRAGTTLRLTVDAALHDWLARSIPATTPAAVVAIETATGAVLALYSSGQSQNEPSDELSGEPSDEPPDEPPGEPDWLGWPVTGRYSAGSAWQVVSAAIALELGVVDATSVMPVACRGGMRYGDRYLRCGDARGHGSLDLPAALAQGCDVYFYQVGLQIGLERLISDGVRLGFGRRVGLDLQAEEPGGFAMSPGASEGDAGPAPPELEPLLLAAGRGSLQVSPVQMAHFFASLARGGAAPAPRVLMDTTVADSADGGVDGEPWTLKPATRAALLDALAGAIPPDAALATGRVDWRGLAGRGTGPDGARARWFVGMAGARGDVPEMVIVVVVRSENGVEPGRIAAGLVDLHLGGAGASRGAEPLDG